MSDRGMMKWNSFNALLAHGSTVKKMMQERTKIPKPELSIDQLEELNDLTMLAYTDKRKVTVYYYSRGYIKDCKGVILSIDISSNCLVFDDNKVKFKSIIKMEIE